MKNVQQYENMEIYEKKKQIKILRKNISIEKSIKATIKANTIINYNQIKMVKY